MNRNGRIKKICLGCDELKPHHAKNFCRNCYEKQDYVRKRRNLRRNFNRINNPIKAKEEWDKYNKGRKKPIKMSNEAINEIIRGKNTSIERLIMQIKFMETELNATIV